ncbi:MAG: YjcZ family sporulation protein [Bacillales bacterium]|nr:YjcZ family sporulation protein [Bacillales bacterium]
MNTGSTFAIILVLFILLVIVGCGSCYSTNGSW